MSQPRRHPATRVSWIVVLAVVGVVVFFIVQRLMVDGAGAEGVRRDRQGGSVPVVVAPIRSGAITDEWAISGSLEARTVIPVAAEVAGRVTDLHVDVGDTLTSATVIGRLADEHFRQAVRAAEADLAVARARVQEAESRLATVTSDAERAEQLVARGVSSQAERDRVVGERLAAEAALAVAEAQVQQAEAALSAATLRLADTELVVDWSAVSDSASGDGERVVGQRFVDPGATIAAGDAVVTVLEIDPLIGRVHVTERGYGRLQPGQPAALQVDAWPAETFSATVARIAPRFDAASRQARVELRVPNDDHRLRPGMFLRGHVRLRAVPSATLVPLAALVQRGGADVVFVVDEAGAQVAQVPVRTGIRQAEQVEILEPDISGRVVILGQHLLEDGSAIVIPAERAGATP